MENYLFAKRDCVRVLKDTETEFEICKFYVKFIKNMHKLYYDPTFEDILKSLSTIRKFKFGISFDGVPFNERINRFVYIYEYSFMHSVVMYDCFFDMLSSNLVILEKITSMKELRLCVLGGGAGFEAVSICKVLSVLKGQSDKKCCPLLLNITIIDICNAWEKDAELIISSAQSEICSSSNIKVDFQFVAADLTADFSEDVVNTLKKSHIVTMCRFLSDVNDSSRSKSKVHQMTQKIIECMSFKACLFFLDNGGSSVFKKTEAMINELAHTFNIYKGSSYICHKLSIDTVEMISHSLRRIFRHLQCTSQMITSCSAWLKVKDMTNIHQLSYGIASISVNNPIYDVYNLEPHKLKNKSRKVKVKKIYQCELELEDIPANI